MIEVPDLLEYGSVVTTANERNKACLCLECILNMAEAIGCLVRGIDPGSTEQA